MRVLRLARYGASALHLDCAMSGFDWLNLPENSLLKPLLAGILVSSKLVIVRAEARWVSKRR